jgi:hypothetical protein
METNNYLRSSAAGPSCSISVTFAPSETTTQTGKLTITDNGPPYADGAAERHGETGGIDLSRGHSNFTDRSFLRIHVLSEREGVVAKSVSRVSEPSKPKKK